MAKPIALVLNSGGLRALVATAMTARESRLAVLRVAGAGPAEAAAAAAFERQVDKFKPVHALVVEIGEARPARETDASPFGQTSHSGARHNPGPHRDLQLLIAGVAAARQTEAGSVVWAAQVDPKHTDAFARTIELAQLVAQAAALLSPEPPLTITTPLMGLTDQQLVALGYQMEAPFEDSWTCRTQSEKPCMGCPSCLWRIKAFRAARVIDPLAG